MTLTTDYFIVIGRECGLMKTGVLPTIKSENTSL